MALFTREQSPETSPLYFIGKDVARKNRIEIEYVRVMIEISMK